nr:hypothetical protein [uncultured Acetatifactor sp.]
MDELDMERENILEKLEQSDMILVGLGEDFDNTRCLCQNDTYRNGIEILNRAGAAWLLPAWNEFCSEETGDRTVLAAIEKAAGLLEGKNYFCVSVSTNSGIPRFFHREESASQTDSRVVMPCGSIMKKQCTKGCGETPIQVTEEDKSILRKFFRELWEGNFSGEVPFLTGECQGCGAPFILNTVYAENYNEKGYLEQWQRYMKWLQGTLNRRLMILELGVGLNFPTVIRWPFEKAAFFNKKAYFYRVNERLYHLTKELSEKGSGIAENAIDWLTQLC